MTAESQPVFRVAEEIFLVGTMAIYGSQAEASEGIPRQWRAFREAHPELGNGARFCGASPCTDDGKIHYMTGVVGEEVLDGDRLTLVGGEYAFVRVEDAAQLRETWIWLLRRWLPGSGRTERNAPEFERFTSVDENGAPVGAVEIWIPLEAVAGG